MMKQKKHQPSKLRDKIPLVETKLSKASEACKTKEPLKKDLIIQLTKLQEKYDNLENEFRDLGKENEALKIKNNENSEKIKGMQKTIENFEKDATTTTKHTQTVRGMDLKCIECNFEALTNTELSWHMGEIHGWSDDQKNEEIDMSAGPRYCSKCDFEGADGYELDGHIWSEHDGNDGESFSCQFCEENFSFLKDLMVHKKSFHNEKVSICWNFSNKTCGYGEDCWFNHKESVTAQNVIECGICEKTFTSIILNKKHMKSEHAEKVKKCSKYKEGWCSYSDNCWFIHENFSIENGENNEKDKNENNEDMVKRLFNIVEKFTKRVIKNEEIMKKHNSNKDQD